MVEPKFAVIYSFKVKKGLVKEFIEAWEALTRLIYQYEHSFGSRLHKISENTFLGYAVWPSKEIWSSSGTNLLPESVVFRTKMREVCEEVKTIYQLDIISDLIKETQFTDK